MTSAASIRRGEAGTRPTCSEAAGLCGVNGLLFFVSNHLSLKLGWSSFQLIYPLQQAYGYHLSFEQVQGFVCSLAYTIS